MKRSINKTFAPLSTESLAQVVGGSGNPGDAFRRQLQHGHRKVSHVDFTHLHGVKF